MEYIITFLEGIISFISPCMLPMLPIYISYFAAGKNEAGGESHNKTVKKDNKTEKKATVGNEAAGHKNNKKVILTGASGFVLGFSIIFVLLGLLSGSLGVILKKYSGLVNIICGIMVVLFGLSYMGIIQLKFFKGIQNANPKGGFVSSLMFGMIYSINLTPCVGAFLGSALMMAATTGGGKKGMLLLLVYSLGLGIPFIISAVLIQELEGAFSKIKSYYGIINRICGIFLIIVGILIMTGMLGRMLHFLS